MKILIAVDGSDYTQRMLSYLGTHGPWNGPEHAYTVVTVVPSIMPRAASMFTKDTLDAYYRDEAEAVFAPVREALSARGTKADFLPLVGQPAEEIAKAADRGAYDLLVMGSHGHGSFGGLVLGSVATKVLSHCTVPVLLVR